MIMDRREFVEKMLWLHVEKFSMPHQSPGHYTMEQWVRDANSAFNAIEKLPEIKEERERRETATEEMHHHHTYYNAVTGETDGPAP